MTDAQLEALRYYVTAVALFMTRDMRSKYGDLTAATANLELAFGVDLFETPPAPTTQPLTLKDVIL